jgi:hypothetical protein
VTDRAWDPGLQPERTALAWRRTGLALTVGSLIGLRVLPPLLGSGWWRRSPCSGRRTGGTGGCTASWWPLGTSQAPMTLTEAR